MCPAVDKTNVVLSHYRKQSHFIADLFEVSIPSLPRGPTTPAWQAAGPFH